MKKQLKVIIGMLEKLADDTISTKKVGPPVIFDDEIIDAVTAAKIMGVQRQAVYLKVKNKKIPFRFNDGKTTFSRNEITEFAAKYKKKK